MLVRRPPFPHGIVFFHVHICLFAEGDVNLLASDEFWDPHAIAGLLKSFLRELPSSLLTRELHLRFLGIMGKSMWIHVLTSRVGLIGRFL